MIERDLNFLKVVFITDNKQWLLLKYSFHNQGGINCRPVLQCAVVVHKKGYQTLNLDSLHKILLFWIYKRDWLWIYVHYTLSALFRFWCWLHNFAYFLRFHMIWVNDFGLKLWNLIMAGIKGNLMKLRGF